MKTYRKPELLAPAGSREAAMAAIENGADAVYFGLDTPTCFNARARAQNIPLDTLSEFVQAIHRRDVRGYVTLNTLAFTDELSTLEPIIREIAAAKVDAVLVQDLGVVRLVHEIAPQLPLHASTQMSLTNAEGVAMAAQLGIKRVVLARELTLDDLRMLTESLETMRETLAKEHLTPPELEVFVHGALCLSFSGQCLASLAMGGRSGNRGRCAQSCRMPYHLLEMVPNAESVRILAQTQAESAGRRKKWHEEYRRQLLSYTLKNVAPDTLYPLSPLDLSTLPLVPELIQLGIASFKIEGRLKPVEYVAEVTAAYRQAIDHSFQSLQNETLDQKSNMVESPSEAVSAKSATSESMAVEFSPEKSTTTPLSDLEETQKRLELTFSRGTSTGWLTGIDPHRLIPGDASSKRGIEIGHVVSVQPHEVAVRLTAEVRRGDGIMFEIPPQSDTELPQERQAAEGGRVFELFVRERVAARSSDRYGREERHGRRDDRYGRGGRDRDSYRDDRRETVEYSYREIKEGRPGETVTMRFGNGAIDFSRLEPNQTVRKTDDPQLEKETRQQLAGRPVRRVALDLRVVAEVNQPLQVEAVAENGARCTVYSEEPLAQAIKYPMTETLLQEQFSRLGETIFELRKLDGVIVGEPLLPLSQFGKVRKTLIEELEIASLNLSKAENTDTTPTESTTGTPTVDVAVKMAQKFPSWEIAGPNRLGLLRERDTSYRQKHPIGRVEAPVIHLLSRSIGFFMNVEILERCVLAGCRSFYGEFPEIGDYAQAARAVRGLRTAHAEFVAVTPRIQKPGEERFLEKMLESKPDAVLVRNLAALNFFQNRHIPTIADFSLNATNDLSANQLVQWGADRITGPYDLNAAGFSRLLRWFEPNRLELIVHGRVPMFFAEHCLWAGNMVDSGRACGRLCRNRPLVLQDRFGYEHPVAADPFCRNIVSYADVQTAAEYLPDWVGRGLRHLRIEMDYGPDLDELYGNAERVEPSLVTIYRELACGEIWPSVATEQLDKLASLHPRSTWSYGMPRREDKPFRKEHF
ncbi:MAG: DUF3656 domain-containing protein [Thermoguttaceae bacterium]|nr:DUF3656 domain-containing protein [Thermoguttaceae bacterium]